jgi:hypothetical protein
MFCPARTTRYWLVWLVIALLPLRGWALAQMAEPVAEVTVAAALLLDTENEAEADLHEDMAMPCHDSGPAATHGTCSLCSVCHAGLAPAPSLVLALPDRLTQVPGPAPVVGLPDGPPSELFRPPRR